MSWPNDRTADDLSPRPPTEGEEPITVFVVDDHDVVRKGLRFYLNACPEIAILGRVGPRY